MWQARQSLARILAVLVLLVAFCNGCVRGIRSDEIFTGRATGFVLARGLASPNRSVSAEAPAFRPIVREMAEAILGVAEREASADQPEPGSDPPGGDNPPPPAAPRIAVLQATSRFGGVTNDALQKVTDRLRDLCVTLAHDQFSIIDRSDLAGISPTPPSARGGAGYVVTPHEPAGVDYYLVTTLLVMGNGQPWGSRIEKNVTVRFDVSLVDAKTGKAVWFSRSWIPGASLREFVNRGT